MSLTSEDPLQMISLGDLRAFGGFSLIRAIKGGRRIKVSKRSQQPAASPLSDPSRHELMVIVPLHGAVNEYQSAATPPSVLIAPVPVLGPSALCTPGVTGTAEPQSSPWAIAAVPANNMVHKK